MPLTLIQDLGRQGARQFGVGTAGAMDPVALQIGNLMVGNAPGAAAIEVSMLPLHLRFLADMDFAVTGATCSIRRGGETLPAWWTAHAHAGQDLVLQAPVERARSRAYVCVAGGIDVPEVLGSRSTQLRGAIGGYRGRPLAAGDRISTGAREPALPVEFGIDPPHADPSLFGQAATGVDVAVRVIPAGEFEWFTAACRQEFWETSWRISAQSNRAAYRLMGGTLEFDHYVEMNSYPVVHGLIQVPPGGAPIVQMMDANVSGGYPKLGVVIGADLWKLGQAGIGSSVRFIECRHREAVEARRKLDAYLATIVPCRQRAQAHGCAAQLAQTKRRVRC